MRTIVLLIVTLVTPCFAQAVTRVACIGDSITYGTGLSNRATQAYPARLQALLGEDYEVRNFGNPGRGIYLHTRRGNTMRGFRHMPEHRAALAWQPDIVICNLGINDCGAFLKTEDERPGTFRDDYLALLTDYAALPSKPKLYVWGKLAPLAPGQTFYRSPEPFLMQAEIAAAARHANATTIDMETPLLPLLLKHFPDRIHPDAEASEVIAETVAKALLPAAEPPAATVTRPANHTGWATPWPAAPVTIPADIAGRCETWLCAGQSNMFWTLDRCAGADSEAAATAKHDIRLWDFVSGQWRRITPANAKEWSALAVSFAIRRAEATGKPIALLLVDVGGAPAEAFLPASVMASVDANGKPRYPWLLRILTNRKPLEQNEDFPESWVKTVYTDRQDCESRGWRVGVLWDLGLARLLGLPLTGVLWYQGESNASTALGGQAEKPLPEPYMEETIRATVETLQGIAGDKAPVLMVGLPVMNRPWAPYRALQKKVCDETGTIYLDTFSRGLGTPDNVHPPEKRPFAELASEAATSALKAVNQAHEH